MKRLIYMALLVFATLNINAQQFSKVITGEIVNTPSGSRSCNFIDINNDDFQDILITNGKTGGENNMIYINNNGESFSLMESVITNDGTPSDGASCADYDNDGNTDVFIVNWYNMNNLLYKNMGEGVFNKIDTGLIATNGGYSETASWGDADNDGFVDLYITNSAGNKANTLFRNTGTGFFEEVVNISPTTDSYYSRSVNWIDYDNDGDQDLFVSNESNQKNNLYRNDGNFQFTKLTDISITSDNYTSISSSWGDYDNDGDYDLFISNYQQNNQLFKNEGNDIFTEVSGPWDTEEDCSFSSSFGDYDNDGDLDLFVTNGYCSNDLQNHLYRNDGDDGFIKVTDELPATDLGNSYGCAWGDYDNNGFLDLVVANWQDETQNNYLYKNEGNQNNWIKINLTGLITNQSAIGVKVRCKAQIDGNSIWQTREVSSQSGYCSQNSLVVHFGLKDAIVIDSLQIQWTSGMIQNFTNLAPNDLIHITEDINTGVGVHTKKISIYPNPIKDYLTLKSPELGAEDTQIEIFNLQGDIVFNSLIKPIQNVAIIDLNELSKGIYILKIRDVAFQENMKIIKE
ncbi:T9SS type A sorting domain-containing protein [Lentimicrobium sp. L6]|uniref:FG-GAP-like repeat-containing protein n=1 Tax=Lentimicrobium sp. L6 TaxID=2735916 RepID=UPI001554732B|nr:FG-GAP-like repeat-containing protein [Lentimicrobium sp. L6]NPD85471.1 T9SS type A sorting domain-containing protein [Lentimicrobium sp. L6]